MEQHPTPETDAGAGCVQQVVVTPNVDDERVHANIRTCMAHSLPEVREVPAHEGHAVLVGSGPSMEDFLPEIARRHVDGQTIFALNGAAKYLTSRRIVPAHGVVLDARRENVKFVGPMDARHWLLASQCHPLLFAVLPAGKVTVWHCAGQGAEDVLGPANPSHFFVRSDATVGLTAMSLVYMMGYRKIHLYGYDSSDRDDEAHAFEQSEDDVERKRIEAWCDGQRFTASLTMYVQATRFPELAQMLTDAGALITVHGTGLLPAVARQMQNASSEGVAA